MFFLSAGNTTKGDTMNATKPATAAAIGSTLSRAGFSSTKGGAKRGFKASKFMDNCVAVTANFGTDAKQREALEAYAAALTAHGYTVEDHDTTLFVSA